MVNRPEQQIHLAVIEHLERRKTVGTLYLHVPNAPRSARSGAMLKRMGMLAGAPDLLLWRNGESFALELKSERGKVSSAQCKFHSKFTQAGGFSWIAHSLDSALMALKSWGLIA